MRLKTREMLSIFLKMNWKLIDLSPLGSKTGGNAVQLSKVLDETNLILPELGSELGKCYPFFSGSFGEN